MAETTLGAVNGEVADARAIDAASRTELVGELNFFVSFVELFLILILNLRVSQ